jgi:hypothetical protein
MNTLFRFPRRLIAGLFLVLFALATAGLGRAQVYVGRPKLIVIVVIDQFRGDYLMRDRAKLTGRGFRLFTEEGAWFTDCYYDYANTKTAPGHATLGTGAYSNGHGIDSNEFWDLSRSNVRKVSSVEDERYQLVDVPASEIPANQPGAAADALHYLIGSSPRSLRATAFGDELRLATQGRSRVYGISLKDRAAILPAGQAANGAFWLDEATGHFTTSTYYMEHLPEWARAFNASGRAEAAAKLANVKGTTQFEAMVGRLPLANDYELDFAKALIEGERLGQGETTDLVTVSLSANDITGHMFGPDSRQQEQMILGLDRSLDSFFGWLDKKIGLGNVWLTLSADHGVAPIAANAARLGVHAATVNVAELTAELNKKLNARFSPGAKVDYLMPGLDLPYVTLNREAFEKSKINEQTAEQALAELLPAAVAAQTPKTAEPLPAQHKLPPVPRVAAVYTKQQLAEWRLPQTEWARLIEHSYVDHGTWFDMVVLEGYQLPALNASGGTTHFSPWSYDRHVPLAFYGAPFRPGEYHERVAPVDMATTLASLAGVNQPSAAVGRVLTEALKSSADKEK